MSESGFTSRIRHERVKMVEVVKGAGIDGGDMILVEEDNPGKLLTVNRYRLLARIVALVVEGSGVWSQNGMRVAFEPVNGAYPNVVLEFCPSCRETVVRVRVEGGQ